MDNRSIGQRIKQARTEAEQTQEDLGKRTGFSQKTISLLENGGIGAVTIETLRAIARATRHPLAFFIGDAPRLAVTLAEVLREAHPEIDENTIREIESFVAWAVSRDRGVGSVGNDERGGVSDAGTEGTKQ